MIWGRADGLIIEIKGTINVRRLNHPQTIPLPRLCVPWNWFLVTQRLGTAVPRSQGLGLRKERFCMNRKRNRKEQIRKVASKVLEIEARLRQGAPVQHQHCPEGYKRGTTEKAKKTKGKVCLFLEKRVYSPMPLYQPEIIQCQHIWMKSEQLCITLQTTPPSPK